jgi:proteasome assembly chaperone (PAC2) family protein
VDQPLNEPWLIAAWPGLGNVAVGAAVYLINSLEMQPVHELAPRGQFAPQHIDIQRGVARTPRMPRSRVFEWRNPGEGRDLLVFVGEAQPQIGGWEICTELMDYAVQRRVTRVVTFAALATQLHPASDPAVYGAVTDPGLLTELHTHAIKLLTEGQIGGLNGVALAAAIERAIPGVCLMAEIPYFAAGVPNLISSRRALEIFTALADVHVELAELQEQGEQVRQALLDLMDRMRAEAERAEEEEEDEEGEEGEEPDEAAAAEPAGPGEQSPGEVQAPSRETTARPGDGLPLEARSRIERLFEDARRNRSAAFRLKEELDRLGVFETYEDRFLDLFRRAE